MPISIRITPTVWMSMPLTSAVTAYLRIAPTAISRSEVPIVIAVEHTRGPGRVPLVLCQDQTHVERRRAAGAPRGGSPVPGDRRRGRAGGGARGAGRGGRPRAAAGEGQERRQRR